MDRFASMAVFVKVVESSSFAAAARHCPWSPALGGRHVHALEEQLGAQLLNRTTRRVSPTEVGQAYYQRVRQILADIEEADRLAADLQATPRGLLRITSSQSFGVRHLAPAIADYLALCPELLLAVTLNDRDLDVTARWSGCCRLTRRRKAGFTPSIRQAATSPPRCAASSISW